MQQLLTKFQQMAHSEGRDKEKECAVITRKAVVLAQPTPPAEAALVPHQVILGWIELRRRARLPPPTLLARLSPDSDCAPVDLMIRIRHRA